MKKLQDIYSTMSLIINPNYPLIFNKYELRWQMKNDVPVALIILNQIYIIISQKKVMIIKR